MLTLTRVTQAAQLGKGLFKYLSVVLGTVLLSSSCAKTVLAQGYPISLQLPQQANASRNAVPHYIPVQSTSSDDKTDDEDRPLPVEIEAMPKAERDLKIIQNRSQLVITKKRIARMVISNDGVLDAVPHSPTELSLMGLALGTTTFTIWFEDQDDPLIYTVRVIRDPDQDQQRMIDYGKLEQKIALLFPNSKVYLIPFSWKIIVKGQARDAEEAAQILNLVRGEAINQLGGLNGPQPFYGGGTGGGFGSLFGNSSLFGRRGFGNGLNSGFIVNMLEVPGEKQVMLRIQVAELNRAQLRRMGVDLTYLINTGRHIVTSAMGGGASTLTGVFENGEITVLLNWLASNGTTKILAEPTLTVLSGHSATFLAGGEFGVPTIVGVGGAQGTSTTFRGYGTSVYVTPTIVDRDLIRLQIVPEFSEIDPNSSSGGVPGLSTRRVQTTVQLREGQTIVLAGLISRQESTEVTRVPYFASIPKLGPLLFQTKRATEDESELLVLVSPEIIRPMDAEEVPPVTWFLCYTSFR